MKFRHWTFFLISIYSLESVTCDLMIEKRRSLIESSPYFVKDISCNPEGQYQWIISNKRYLAPKNKSLSTKELAAHKKRLKKRLPASANDFPLKQNTKSINQKTSRKKTHSLSLGFSSSVSSISSTDNSTNSTEKATSDNGYGVSATWTHLWTDRLSYFVTGSIKKYSFIMGTGRTLTDSDLSHSYIGTGLNIKLGDRITLIPGLGIGESLILSSTGGTSFEIKKASIPTVSLSSKIDLLKFDSGFSFYTNLRAGALSPTSQSGYKTELGHYEQIGFGSSFGLWGSQMNINTSYTQRKLDVGTATQTSKDLGISVGVGWSF